MSSTGKAREEAGALWELAWPIATAMLSETAMGLVDTKLVGVLGPAALGGVGMATVLLYLSFAMGFGLMRGVKVRAAYAMGEGRPQDAWAYARAGMLLGTGLGACVWVATRDVTTLLVWLGADASMVPYARDFLAARTFGAPATFAAGALVQALQGVGDARTPMRVGIMANVLNAAIAFCLIHGKLGLPALGVTGAGMGTAFAEWVQLAVLAWAVVRRRSPRSEVRLGSALREVASLGVPTGVHFALETLAFTAFSAVLGTMGAEQFAAHQIALMVLRASFLPGAAVAEAACVLVGRALAAKRIEEADRTVRAAIAMSVTFMVACGLLFAVAGSAIAGWFTTEAGVVRVASRLFLVAALFQALDAINFVLRAALRGAKDVRWVAVVGTTVAFVCVPGAALVLGRWAGLGAVGGWLGFVAETAIGAALYGWRWRRGSWRLASRDSRPDPDRAAVAVPA